MPRFLTLARPPCRESTLFSSPSKPRGSIFRCFLTPLSVPSVLCLVLASEQALPHGLPPFLDFLSVPSVLCRVLASEQALPHGLPPFLDFLSVPSVLCRVLASEQALPHGLPPFLDFLSVPSVLCLVLVRSNGRTTDGTVYFPPLYRYGGASLVPSPTLGRWVWLPAYSKLGQHYVSGPRSGPAI